MRAGGRGREGSFDPRSSSGVRRLERAPAAGVAARAGPRRFDAICRATSEHFRGARWRAEQAHNLGTANVRTCAVEVTPSWSIRNRTPAEPVSPYGDGGARSGGRGRLGNGGSLLPGSGSPLQFRPTRGEHESVVHRDHSRARAGAPGVVALVRLLGEAGWQSKPPRVFAGLIRSRLSTAGGQSSHLIWKPPSTSCRMDSSTGHSRVMMKTMGRGSGARSRLTGFARSAFVYAPLRYLFALAMVAASFGLRLLLSPWAGSLGPGSEKS
jgi:hypothetical protein